MSGAVEDIKKIFSNPMSLINPLVAGTSDWLTGQTSAPDLPAPGSVAPPKYDPAAGMAEDFASRQRAASAAAAAPGSASSVLTSESDPLGTKRQRLLGLG